MFTWSRRANFPKKKPQGLNFYLQKWCYSEYRKLAASVLLEKLANEITLLSSSYTNPHAAVQFCRQAISIGSFTDENRFMESAPFLQPERTVNL